MTDDYLRFLRTTADHLLALDLGLVNGQVIPTQIRDSTRGEIRRILVDAFERLSTLDGEIAMSWLSGLAQ